MEYTTEAENSARATFSTTSAPTVPPEGKNGFGKRGLMEKWFAVTPPPPSLGELAEGAVIALDQGRVFVDLPPFGTGIIYGREYVSARDIIKKINCGDRITAKVIGFSTENGYIELSLKEAHQAMLWAEAEAAVREKRIFELPIREANKGGLLLEWQGIEGFLPASQLKAEHYPRVEDGDKEKILEELKKLVGQKLQVCILSAIPKEGKVIFSEKSTAEKEREKIIGKYVVGDEIEGTVTGVVDFGVFVKLEEGLEGLVHISEIDWTLVENPKLLYKVNDTARARIIEIKDSKISLSMKVLKPNPWLEIAKKYQKGDLVAGVVIRFNKHGALASIEEGIAGLVHISEFGSEEDLRRNLELGKTYNFKVVLIDPKDQRMALSFAGEKK